MRYLAIQKRIQAEADLRHFLYLVSNYDLVLFLMKKFEGCRRPVYFGLRQDFLTEGLCLSVQSSHSPVSTSFLAVLRHGLSRPGGWRTSASQNGARFTYCRGFEVGLEWNWREWSPCNLLIVQRLSLDYILFRSSISGKRPRSYDTRAALLG